MALAEVSDMAILLRNITFDPTALGPTCTRKQQVSSNLRFTVLEINSRFQHQILPNAFWCSDMRNMSSLWRYRIWMIKGEFRWNRDSLFRISMPNFVAGTSKELSKSRRIGVPLLNCWDEIAGGIFSPTQFPSCKIAVRD